MACFRPRKVCKIDFVGPRNDVGADQLADPAGGLGAGLDGRADAADVALDQGRDEPAADLDAAGQGARWPP